MLQQSQRAVRPIAALRRRWGGDDDEVQALRRGARAGTSNTDQGMKVVILAGGKGTRISEETGARPKPMIEIGERPILWHIMKHFSHYGFCEFVVALGYKGDAIKEYIFNYGRYDGDATVDLAVETVERFRAETENWKVHLVDTGQETLTGGRVKRLKNLIGNERFFLTYGDGVADVDLQALLRFHESAAPVVTVTAVHPASRFGTINFDGQRVTRFTEKSQVDVGWINGGYMVMEPAVFDYLEGDRSVLELDALEALAQKGKLAGFKHEGFWHCMDNLRDKNMLQALWDSGSPPWKIW